MPRPFDTEFNEYILIKHNIATAVAIVAANNDISPKESEANYEMGKILDAVKKAYEYTLWSIERHHPSITSDITYHFGSGTWSSKPNDQA